MTPSQIVHRPRFEKYHPTARFPAWHQYNQAIWTGSITEDNNTYYYLDVDLGILQVRPRQAQHPKAIAPKAPKLQFLYHLNYGHFLNYNHVDKTVKSYRNSELKTFLRKQLQFLKDERITGRNYYNQETLQGNENKKSSLLAEANEGNYRWIF